MAEFPMELHPLTSFDLEKYISLWEGEMYTQVHEPRREVMHFGGYGERLRSELLFISRIEDTGIDALTFGRELAAVKVRCTSVFTRVVAYCVFRN